MPVKSDKPLPMEYMAQEFLDLLFWKLHRILSQEGVSVLQWAFMQRAYLQEFGVPFSAILKATGESKDNVRRAARSLEEANVGKVSADPNDRRARSFTLTKLGRRRTLHVKEAFEAELLASVGAREIFSKRARQFASRMWEASSYLASGDLAKKGMVEGRKSNRTDVPDDSLRYVESPKRARSVFIDPE